MLQGIGLECGKPIDCRDVLLHAIMDVGLNVGLRYDEVCKMKIEDVTVTPGVRGTGSILLNITVNTKNSTTGREYILTEWPGNTRMRHSVLMDSVCCSAVLDVYARK